DLGLAAVRWGVGDRDGAGARNLEVLRLVLVTVGVTTDDDRLGPPGHQARHVGDDDRLAEDDAAEDVADRAVGALPHLLEPELLHPRLVRRDGRALDPDAVLLDGVGRVDRDLVVGLVALLDAQVVVLEVDVQVRVDQPLLDELPDDARHLVAIELDDRVGDLDLLHACRLLWSVGVAVGTARASRAAAPGSRRASGYRGPRQPVTTPAPAPLPRPLGTRFGRCNVTEENRLPGPKDEHCELHPRQGRRHRRGRPDRLQPAVPDRQWRPLRPGHTGRAAPAGDHSCAQDARGRRDGAGRLRVLDARGRGDR